MKLSLKGKSNQKTFRNCWRWRKDRNWKELGIRYRCNNWKISESDLADDDLLEQPAFEEPAETETELELEPETPEEALSEKPQSSDSVSSMIDEWENKKSEPKEEDPVRSKIDEFDEALQTKIEALWEKKEEFRELNLEAELGIISAENEVIYNQMKIELKEREEEIELLKHERRAIDEDMFVSPEGPYVSDGFLKSQMILKSKSTVQWIVLMRNQQTWPAVLHGW